MPWKWATIRAAFLAKRGKRPQADIAKVAGLRQNAISKLENNDNLGPAVEVFLNAVDGLGVPVSKFFEELERSQNKGLPLAKVSATTAVSNPSPDEAASHEQGRNVSAAARKRQSRTQLLEDGLAVLAELGTQGVVDRFRPPTNTRRKTPKARKQTRARRQKAS